MKKIFRAANVLFVLFAIVTATGFAEEQTLPVVNGKEIVATVNGEPITRDELDKALVMRHADAGEKQKAGRISFSQILNRLVNTRLFLLESRNMGLDELPEVKEDIDNYSRNTLIQVLLKQQTKDIFAEEQEVEAVYREMVKEYKMQSLLFEKEEEAKEIGKEIGSGRDFQEIARKVLAEGAAKGGEEGQYIKEEELLPEIKKAVSKMEVGSVSPVIMTRKGYALVKVEEIRYPDDPGAKEQAERIVLEKKKARKTIQFLKALKKEYAIIRNEVLDGLDYEAEVPGFEALLKDRRTVAEIKGEKPVTVGDLSKALRKKYFHGVERAVKKKSINNRKWEVFEVVLNKRVVHKEALRRGIDKTATYMDMVREYENSVLFGVFMQKVIQPGIRLEEKDIKAYYEKNPAEFSSPEKVGIESLVFSQRGRAEETMQKLKEGTDFSWLVANAEGQEDKNSEGLLKFEGNLLSSHTLPESVRKAISGAKPGEYRLCESPEGHFYVLAVKEVIPPKTMPYEMVRNDIARKVLNEKTNRELDAYAGKLREVYPVEVFLKDIAS